MLRVSNIAVYVLCICHLLVFLTGFRIPILYSRPLKCVSRPFFASTSTSIPELESPEIQLQNKLRSTSIYLVGMMGSGKSTVGKKLAEKLSYRFLDTDEIAEHMIAMPISNYFEAGREQEFRELENQILMEICQYTKIVVSTGGGIVMRNENWAHLRHGLVVFLNVAPDSIILRLSKNPSELAKRPLLSGPDPVEKFRNIYRDRLENYNQADIKIPISESHSIDEVANLVVFEMLSYINDNPPMWQTWKERRFQKEEEE